jgi:hypothetical protein
LKDYNDIRAGTYDTSRIPSRDLLDEGLEKHMPQGCIGSKTCVITPTVMKAIYKYTKDTVPKDKCPSQDKLRILTYCKSENLGSSEPSKSFKRSNLTFVVVATDIVIILLWLFFSKRIEDI